MDFEAQLVSSIEVAVQAAVEAAVERSMQALTAVMSAYTDNSKHRLLREIKEIEHALDVGVHNVDTSAALASAATTFDSSVKPQATVVFGNDPDMAASHGVDLAATTPATCSTQYPSRAVTVLVPALAPADVSSIPPIRDSAFEESVDERTRRLRRRIELAEDRARRDPVWAEKMARRHAAFRDAMESSTSTAASSVLTERDGNLAARPPTTCSTNCPGRAAASAVSTITRAAASTPSTVTVGVVSEQCCFDIEPAAMTSTSPAPASILSGDASMVIGEAPVTTACTARDACVYPVAQLVAMPIPVPVAMVDCAPTMSAPSADITLSPRVLTPATTKPVSSAALDSGLIMVSPTTSSVACLDPIPVAPATMLTHATLDIMDSGGSAVLVTMSAQLDKLEGDDTALTYKDEQLLACSSVEQPFALVAASDVADDYSLVTSASVVLLTLAALNVHDGRITNEDKVVLPLKLMDMTLLETKDQNMSPLLPKFTQAMVPWCTSLNQLHAKYSGTSSHLDCGSATTHLISLLPWDPGEKTSVSRVSVISGDSAWGACVEQLDAQLSGSCDHHHKNSGFCSSENAIGKCCCQGISVQLLQYQFDYASTFSKLYVEHIIACAPGYPANCEEQVPFEDFLLGSFGVVQKNFHPEYLQESEYLSLATGSIPYHYALVPAGMILPYGSVSLPWEMFWSSLFDILGAIQSTRELCSCIFWSRAAVLLIFSMEIQTLRGPMEQWDPGVARWITRHIRRVNCHFASLNLVVYLVHPALNIADQGRLKSYRLLTVWICELISRRDSLCTILRNAKQLIGADISCQKQLCYRSTAEIFSSDAHCEEIVQANFIAVGVAAWYGLCARPRPTENFSVHHKARSKGHDNIFGDYKRATRATNVDPIFLYINLVHIGRNYCFDYACCFDNVRADDDYYYDTFFAQVHAGQDLYLDAYLDKVHIGNDYYIGVFLEQVDAICYLNLVKVCFDYGSRHDLNEVLKQVPWDPGGSTWHRLEVKPKFKEGGMLATSFPNITVGWTVGLCLYRAWASRKPHERSYIYESFIDG